MSDPTRSADLLRRLLAEVTPDSATAAIRNGVAVLIVDSPKLPIRLWHAVIESNAWVVIPPRTWPPHFIALDLELLSPFDPSTAWKATAACDGAIVFVRRGHEAAAIGVRVDSSPGLG